MAESMVSIVVGLTLIGVVIMFLRTHNRREHQAERLQTRLDGHRLWDRMRHRH
ncbi:hypothetical protein [Paraburkholderia sp.]|uniref:hypothetical protein n=1 Tax=Paraburkholderia sp. TaxID=1926495 RepID=UPI002F4115D3